MHPQNEIHRTPGWCPRQPLVGGTGPGRRLPMLPGTFCSGLCPPLPIRVSGMSQVAFGAAPLQVALLLGQRCVGLPGCGLVWHAGSKWRRHSSFWAGAFLFPDSALTGARQCLGVTALSPGSCVTVQVRCGDFESRLIHRWRNLPV